MRVCSQPGCPELIPTAGRCPTHARLADRARGTRQQRGYTAEHDRLRKTWEPKVQAGTVRCWRCGDLIRPDEAWDLGHLADRSRYGGPEHAYRCNRSAAGRASHQR